MTCHRECCIPVAHAENEVSLAAVHVARACRWHEQGSPEAIAARLALVRAKIARNNRELARLKAEAARLEAASS